MGFEVIAYVTVFLCGVITKKYDGWYSHGNRESGTFLEGVQRGVIWCILTALISLIAMSV